MLEMLMLLGDTAEEMLSEFTPRGVAGKKGKGKGKKKAKKKKKKKKKKK